MDELLTIDQIVDAKISEVLKQHPIIQEAYDYIEQEHSARQYHNLNHTQDVVKTAVRICMEEGISTEETVNICISSAYHDYFQGPDHEEKNANFVKDKMRAAGYKPKDIEEVVGGIKSTKVDGKLNTRDTPTNNIEKIIQDADVTNFGRGDNIALFLAYYRELMGKEYELDEISRRKAFLEKTISIFKNHSCNTKSAQSLFEKRKLKNLAILEQELKVLNTPV